MNHAKIVIRKYLENCVIMKILRTKSCIISAIILSTILLTACGDDKLKEYGGSQLMKLAGKKVSSSYQPTQQRNYTIKLSPDAAAISTPTPDIEINSEVIANENIQDENALELSRDITIPVYGNYDYAQAETTNDEFEKETAKGIADELITNKDAAEEAIVNKTYNEAVAQVPVEVDMTSQEPAEEKAVDDSNIIKEKREIDESSVTDVVPQYEETIGTRTGRSGNGNNFNTYDIPEQQDTEDIYVLNTNTFKFYIPTCKDVRKIKPENYATSSDSRWSIIAQGYSPCGHCNP